MSDGPAVPDSDSRRPAPRFSDIIATILLMLVSLGLAGALSLAS